MDPQAFIRLSVGSLALRSPKYPLNPASTSDEKKNSCSQCSCEIKLRGFPVQTTSIPLMPSLDAAPDHHSVSTSFYLEESDLRALLTPGCFYNPNAHLEISVFTGKKSSSHCGVGAKRQQIGVFKLEVGPEWGEGKPVILFNGWIGIGKNKRDGGAQLHLRVKLDPDPRYVFQFEDVTTLSPQIVQLRGSVKQPIFSCKFSRDRVSQVDPLNGYWSSSGDGTELGSERRERKGWKVKIHDLSGSAVAAAFITTPFVPSTGCDWVAKSNPGAWHVVRPDPCRPNSWQPWGKLEAWRERGIRDSVCCRFHILSNGQEVGDVLMSEILISAEKGGEFLIDTDKQMLTVAATPIPSPQSSGDYSGLGQCVSGGGFVMSSRVQGEGKSSKPVVQLAMRHVTCVEDAAIFMALAAAVDLSILACKPFRRTSRRRFRHYSW
ncbi:PREDICTED: uncharacterized protein LOC106318262 [Brassica oleracea var. oleracea]|uniref:Uncharacterized protein n=1 Tax=Brassica oleracea var. oleracea TaxID=109376 RepID=A0A0D3EEQ0_BRAOL|nr:PREDICTED: uncharacterized protein LOC106318262 [Brassica oleracea var. oleracea]XP_013611614.1 PREDICTED: uncharacterized protein LOC106318262 [Brassica oleracea var. oleracea]XP_013611615.1 PREDICTED: uncharacterized protein LOC106318262 [Brassica oleracea var. oleracea]